MVGEDSLPWAEQLLSWVKTQKYSLNVISYTPLLTLLENCKQHSRVNELVDHLACKQKVVLNEVVLGSLVNAACSKHGCRRVEELWDLFVNKLHVKPNLLAYRARCKAHLIAGKPVSAAEVISHMEASGLPTTAARTVKMRLQALLIVCHAEPTKFNKKQLKACLAHAETADVREVGKTVATELRQLIKLARQVLSNPSTLQLPDLLVESFAKHGIMGSWPRHKANSKYLPKEDSSFF